MLSGPVTLGSRICLDLLIRLEPSKSYDVVDLGETEEEEEEEERRMKTKKAWSGRWSNELMVIS